MYCRIYIPKIKFQWHLILIVLVGASIPQDSAASQCFGCDSDSSSDEKFYIAYNPTHIYKSYQNTAEISYTIHSVIPEKLPMIATEDAQSPNESIDSKKTGEDVKFPNTAQQTLK